VDPVDARLGRSEQVLDAGAHFAALVGRLPGGDAGSRERLGLRDVGMRDVRVLASRAGQRERDRGGNEQNSGVRRRFASHDVIRCNARAPRYSDAHSRAMAPPRAVVIPLGVPTEGRGLGLGLAALMHAFVHVEGGGVAIAQLHARRNDEPADAAPSPVEAFVPPQAWRDIAGRGDAPAGVGVVLTGAFEPPVEGHGTIQLLAYDARDGHTRARVDAPLDGAHAGASLVGAFDRLWSLLGGEIGAMRAIGDLDWDALESVLRAERCALHDPLRGGPHDRLAAMAHLGRAIGDAPRARYPIERLAAIALETAMGPALDERLAAAAARALERAVADAPDHAELAEALVALELRLGRLQDAERRTVAALATAPKRPRLYALLAQALRAQGKLDAALAALQAGLAEAAGDPLLCTERGTVLGARGDFAGAAAAWREALARDPVHPGAFTQLAALAVRTRDGAIAQSLVDAALAAPHAHPDVLRRSIQLALATEADGIARASRVSRLCTKLLEMLPDEPGASLAQARAMSTLGERVAARERLAHVLRVAPKSPAAAEAQPLMLALVDPAAGLELQSVLRAALSGSAADMPVIAARGRAAGMQHEVWTAWFAAGIAEKRLGRWQLAAQMFAAAIDASPGAPPAHNELAEALLQTDKPKEALEHAERLIALEGESAKSLLLLARTLAATDRPADARAAAERALAMQPSDPDVRALLARLKKREEGGTGWMARLLGALRKPR
jgi:tetratricopeptide (TPR) repeat protein